MRKRFIVMSGLPGSGKTTLALRLGPVLNLPVIDKDDILERLFESKGVGTAAWRRTLSRESDLFLQQQATRSTGAILVSFWRLPGMPADSGTPVDWLMAPEHQVLNIHCVCEPEVAATRFLNRRRHPGHLDSGLSYVEVLTNLRKIVRLGPLDIGHHIDVDTSQEPNREEIIRAIRTALG